ncbi:MAG TPA: 30S ribosome-binding factor RbfA [bacterium]|nr:30S ribosome-binding factor RbfA [bacterium]
MGKRTIQVGRLIRNALADLIAGMRDTRVREVTLTDVVISTDLLHARVYLDVFGDEADAARAVRALERASGYLRRGLAEMLNLRNTPELRFLFDSNLRRGERVSRLLRDTEEPVDE